MSFPLTDARQDAGRSNRSDTPNRPDLTDRAARLRHLAKRAADQLAERQKPDGHFVLPDFYGKAFAVLLWTQLDQHRYRHQIRRALRALETEPHRGDFHREFVEYALHRVAGLSPTEISRILRDAPRLFPDVANWQVLGLANRQSGPATWGQRSLATLHWWFIRARYWHAPLFRDRPDCFSAQYHAFCAALLWESPLPAQREIAAHATALIAKLAARHGHATLLGRGAGQSFGAACALFALLAHGWTDQADAILSRLEDAVRTAGTIPLNLLAPEPLPDAPGPCNRATPGWYSYNRHDDYLAFAGYWLLRASRLPPPDRAGTIGADLPASGQIALFATPHYHAQMNLSGRASFDRSASPVVISGCDHNAAILLPPCGGEEDAPSIYGPANTPLPAIEQGPVARFVKSSRTGENRITITLVLDGHTGHRRIEFRDTEIRITDTFPDTRRTDIELFRILIDHRIGLGQPSAGTLICAKQGITISSDADLEADHHDAFSAAGRATRITAKGRNTARLVIKWGTGDA